MQGRIRPSKPASIFGMVVGGVFVLIGLAMAIPTFGWFGVLWTLVALGIAVFSAINAFSRQGVAQQVIDFDAPAQPKQGALSAAPIEERLRELEELRATVNTRSGP